MTTRPKPMYRCIGARVLIAAKFTYRDCWQAFVLPVPGRCFDDEVEQVYREGSKVDRDLAEFLFPEFATFPYDR